MKVVVRVAATGWRDVVEMVVTMFVVARRWLVRGVGWLKKMRVVVMSWCSDEVEWQAWRPMVEMVKDEGGVGLDSGGCRRNLAGKRGATPEIFEVLFKSLLIRTVIPADAQAAANAEESDFFETHADSPNQCKRSKGN
ncbi:hypothetical protein Tco_0576777 [Tanacetum coccineum]